MLLIKVISFFSFKLDKNTFKKLTIFSETLNSCYNNKFKITKCLLETWHYIKIYLVI